MSTLVHIITHYCDISLTVKLQAINVRPHQNINLQTTYRSLFATLSRQHIGNKDVH